MPNGGFGAALPIAATMDLQYRLPPFQQILFTPTIIVSIVMLGIALFAVLYLSRRSKLRAAAEQRREALNSVEKILLKRGGRDDDVERMLFIFSQHPNIDPSVMIMIKDRFQRELTPVLASAFDEAFAEKMEALFFPPPRDTRRALAGQSRDAKALVEEGKEAAAERFSAAILDLMDATLRPGVVVRLTFEGLENGHDCVVMGHNMQAINVTLPAYSEKLVAALQPGMSVNGTLESGPSLLAFTASVVQAVAGSMPYCRISAWKSAWEICKRDSVRFPTSVEIDFQHISTSQSENIKMANLDRVIGSVRPGRLLDVSLGGCCVETPSAAPFRIGDMIRFSKALIEGTPPMTLLGAIINTDRIEADGVMKQRLHIQFLIIDDVSQRILARSLRQLQDVAKKKEWMKAQHLLQQMQRNNVENIGSPASSGMEDDGSEGGTGVKPATDIQRLASGAGNRGSGPRTELYRRPPTRIVSKPPSTRTSVRPKDKRG